MKHAEDDPARTRRGRIPRSRGAVTGLLLIVLGVWGALIPFIGPNFDFAYTPGQAWTAARGWLEVLPGVATAVGGLLLVTARSRASGMLGGWLAAAGGAWFVVGGAFAPVLGLGSVGDPVGRHRPQACGAGNCVLLRLGRADRLPGRGCSGAARRRARA